MASLFLINRIKENTSTLLEFNLVCPKLIKNLDNHHRVLLEKIKPNCLVLSEAFVFNEKLLHSAIADENEKPYDNLYSLAKTYGALNKVNLAPYYLKTI